MDAEMWNDPGNSTSDFLNQSDTESLVNVVSMSSSLKNSPSYTQDRPNNDTTTPRHQNLNNHNSNNHNHNNNHNNNNNHNSTNTNNHHEIDSLMIMAANLVWAPNPHPLTSSPTSPHNDKPIAAKCMLSVCENNTPLLNALFSTIPNYALFFLCLSTQAGWGSMSLFHFACLRGQIDVAKYLFYIVATRIDALSAEGMINHKQGAGTYTQESREPFDMSPLHLASLQGHSEVCRWLVDKGARVTDYDRNGCHPFHSAVIASKIEILRFFIYELDYNPLTPLGPNKYNEDSKDDDDEEEWEWKEKDGMYLACKVTKNEEVFEFLVRASEDRMGGDGRGGTDYSRK